MQAMHSESGTKLNFRFSIVEFKRRRRIEQFQPRKERKYQKNQNLASGAPDALSLQHLLPWIWKLVLVYQYPDKNGGEEMLPQGASFSKSKRVYKNHKLN